MKGPKTDIVFSFFIIFAGVYFTHSQEPLNKRELQINLNRMDLNEGSLPYLDVNLPIQNGSYVSYYALCQEWGYKSPDIFRCVHSLSYSFRVLKKKR